MSKVLFEIYKNLAPDLPRHLGQEVVKPSGLLSSIETLMWGGVLWGRGSAVYSSSAVNCGLHTVQQCGARTRRIHRRLKQTQQSARQIWTVSGKQDRLAPPTDYQQNYRQPSQSLTSQYTLAHANVSTLRDKRFGLHGAFTSYVLQDFVLNS